MTDSELIEIGNQLSFPVGKKGIEIGKTMNQSNHNMIIESINNLNITEESFVLEIGHGNCNHLPVILNRAANVKYLGLEISEIMMIEAKRLNDLLITQSDAQFKIFDGENIPITGNTFDKIISVNTIYFWVKPAFFLNEIYKVLKKDGVFVLAYVQKKLMRELPFVTEKFELYDNRDIKKIVEMTDFDLIKILDKEELVKSKSGEMVNRSYSIAILKKNKK